MALIEQFRSALMEGGWEPNTEVLLAVSGGMDSLCLLKLADELGMTGTVLHMNFKLRGKEADGDACWVAREAVRLGWKCQIAHHPIGECSDGIQAAARTARYHWFQKVASNQQLILTAHHADDQAETVLLHLLRASDPIAAIAGMPPRQGNVLRPLLSVRRTAIAEWADQNGVVWREDRSNDDPKYLRNRVRHEVLPLLEDLRPGSSGHISKLAKRARAVADDLNTIKLNHQSNPREFRLHPHSHFYFECLHSWCKPLGIGADSLLRLSQTGAAVETDHGHIIRERDGFVFRAKQEAPFGEQQLACPSSSGQVGDLSWEVLASPPANPRVSKSECLLDAGAVVWPLTLRPWKAGDSMSPYGMKGKQLVSDLLTQAKVPSAKRPSYRVLADARGTIHWLLGVRAARQAAVKRTTSTTIFYTLSE